MAKTSKLLKLGSRIIYKVRHHKGHGIHSPFVFKLINNVIEEKLPYYAYSTITEHLADFKEVKLKVNKDNLLMFRLVNYFGAKKILEIGSSTGINTLCLTAPSKNIDCICVEKNNDKQRIAKLLYSNYDRNIVLKKDLTEIVLDTTYDCIYLNISNYKDISIPLIEELCKLCHDKSFIVVKGIRSNKKQKQLWNCLIENESRTVLLDLFNIGIIFFDKQLSRWEYKISF